MRIGEDRRREVRERSLGRSAFGGGPAVVLPRAAEVDLLEAAGADVVDVHAAGAGLDANVNGFRRPYAQMARLSPVVVLKNGLSVGIVPSGLMRRILPWRL